MSKHLHVLSLLIIQFSGEKGIIEGSFGTNGKFRVIFPGTD